MNNAMDPVAKAQAPGDGPRVWLRRVHAQRAHDRDDGEHAGDDGSLHAGHDVTPIFAGSVHTGWFPACGS